VPAYVRGGAVVQTGVLGDAAEDLAGGAGAEPATGAVEQQRRTGARAGPLAPVVDPEQQVGAAAGGWIGIWRISSPLPVHPQAALARTEADVVEVEADGFGDPAALLQASPGWCMTLRERQDGEDPVAG